MRIAAFFLFSMLCLNGFGQDVIHIHLGSNTENYNLNDNDSLYFSSDYATMYFRNNTTLHTYSVSNVQEITFTSDITQNVRINYSGNSVTVNNPLSSAGVEVATLGGTVVVTNTGTEKDINYIVSGTTTNGSLKVYSDTRYNVLLNDAHITNPIGPAFNGQSEKKATIQLLAGTNNTLADGEDYSDPEVVGGVEEDQKAALFSESDVLFIGGGNLSVAGTGLDQHAIASDKSLELKEGIVTVVSAVKDGFHGSSGVSINGGMLNITASGDGIDGENGKVKISCGDLDITCATADVAAIKCDSTLTVDGGTTHITISGAKAKGLKSGKTMYLEGGNIFATTSGAAVLTASGSGQTVSYSSLVTSDSTIYLDGAAVELTTTGIGSRGISAGSDLVMSGGALTITSSGNGAAYTNSSGTADAYHGACIKADGNVSVNGGTLTVTNSGTGGKGVDCDGTIVVGANDPGIDITTTGTKITITAPSGGPGGNPGTYDEAKAVKTGGDFTMNSGTLNIASADDGIKADGTVTVNSGDLVISNSDEGIQAPFITVNGGSVSITASDDAFNATHGTQSGGTESDDGSLLKITGGYCVVSSTGGDGMDSNGSVQVSGGTVIVHGPQSSPELGLDYNGTGTVSGGFVVISGPGQQMLQGFETASTQRSFILKTGTSIPASTLFHVEDASGNELFTFRPVRGYETIVFSSPAITNGAQYKIYTSGSDSGTATNGLYSGGIYTPGTLKSTFTATGSVTTVSF